MDSFRAEGEVVKARRQAVVEEIDVLKQERAAQEEMEKEQLALLLRMRKAHELREKRNADTQVCLSACLHACVPACCIHPWSDKRTAGYRQKCND
jgi:hypothetical protein